MSEINAIRASVELKGRLLVLFDGECGFCNRAVRWLIARDSQDRLRFAPNQSYSEFSGANSLIVVLPDDSALRGAEAILAALRELPPPWPLLGSALRLLPRGIREWGYRAIARNRHRLGDRTERCPVPNETERQRFL